MRYSKNNSQLKVITTRIGILIWSICALFYAFEFFLRSSTNALAPIFHSTFGFNATATSIIGSSFYWFYVIAQLPAGICVDKFGIKKVMIIATLVTSIGMLFFTFSYLPWQFTLSRAMIGFGGGFAFISSLKAAAMWLPNRMFPTFAGLTQLFGYLGGAASGLPLIMLLQTLSLSRVLMIIFGITIIIFLLSILFIKTHPEYSSGSTAKYENKSLKDIINSYLVLMKNPQLLINGLYCLCICGTTAIFADLWGITYFQKVYGYSSETAAYACSLIFLGVAFSSPMWGIIATIIDNNKKLLVVASAIGIVILSVLLYVKVNIIILCILCFLFGTIQSVHVLNFTIIARQVSKEKLGMGIAFINLFIPLSGAILQPISGFIIQICKNTSMGSIMVYKISMLIIPILLLIATILGLAFKENKKLEKKVVYSTTPP